MTIKEILNKIEVQKDWLAEYNKFVPLFIKEAETKTKWEDWDEKVFFEFFERSADQCVSSLRQGYFTHNEQDKIKEHWEELSPYLKILATNQTKPQWNSYDEIKNIIRKYTSQDRRAATNRLIASLQPQLLCTIVNEKKLHELYDCLSNIQAENLPKYVADNWFRNSYNLQRYFQDLMPDQTIWDIVTYPWQVWELLTDKSTNHIIPMENIEDVEKILLYKKQIILQGAPGTGKTYMAKNLAQFIILGPISRDKEEQSKLLGNSQYKFIQFHPSYTYEDFVRGIVVDTESGIPKYTTINKVLGAFAQEAYQNWTDSQKEVSELSKEEGYKIALTEYKNYIIEELSKSNELRIQDTSASIISVEDESFKYRFENSQVEYNLLFSDIIKVELNIESITKSTDLENLGLKMKGKHPYYYHFHEMFLKYIQEHKIQTKTTAEKIKPKNYVLIIDEINRANLPCVLGELIYALEYRGEKVESMYAVDGDNGLVLPPNLYIIGTMNTADRSVGQIDYAIRRRFAFINMLPKVLKEESLEFDLDLFKAVSSFFIDNIEEYINDPDRAELKRSKWLSDEFCPEDVWIGHSYFIMKGINRDIRLNYEIKPILKEYLKDGILKEKVDGKSTKTKINDL